MAGQTSAVVQLDDVTKSYRIGKSEVRALRGITLSIPARAFTMLVAPSGSGKSTLLNLIGCIDNPTSGVVTIAGQIIAQLSDRALSDFRAQKIGFIFQGFSLVPVLSAYENVEYPLMLTRVPAAARRRATLSMLEAVGLSEQQHRRLDRLPRLAATAAGGGKHEGEREPGQRRSAHGANGTTPDAGQAASLRERDRERAGIEPALRMG